MARARPVAVVTTGDNVYERQGVRGAGRRLLRPLGRVGDLLPTAGNHDHEQGIDAFDAYFPSLEDVTSTRRSRAESPSSFSTARLPSSRRRTWRSSGRGCERALLRRGARWKVVVLHHPPFSSGTVHGSSPQLRWPFGQWGADLVLSGHEHNYERLIADGTTFVVDGAGGKDLYPFGSPLPGRRCGSAASFGALFLTPTPSPDGGVLVRIGAAHRPFRDPALRPSAESGIRCRQVSFVRFTKFPPCLPRESSPRTSPSPFPSPRRPRRSSPTPAGGRPCSSSPSPS